MNSEKLIRKDHQQTPLESALDEITRIWIAFIANTKDTDRNSPHFSDQRGEMTTRINEFIDTQPDRIREKLTDLSDPTLDEKLDEMMQGLRNDEEFKNHPSVEEWFKDE